MTVQHALPSLLERLPTPDVGAPRTFRLSVLVPVYNERHVVAASLRRVLALEHPLISSLQLLVVDDHSTDGTWDVLQRVAAEDPRVVLLRHELNQGKGAAVRTAVARATGDVSVVHDADLEYDPADLPSLLVPFAQEGADAVFGSRYLSAPYRRALMHRHTLINRALTALSNWFTDLNLTDVETCYKAVTTTLLQSIPLRSDDFRFEVELERATRFNLWLGDVLRPYVGDAVLEVGAGIGTLTNQFIPRDLYVASDINPHYLRYLKAYAVGKPYLRVLKVDAADPADFQQMEGEFDTVLIVNVLEHVEEEATLRNLHRALRPGGCVVVLVPQHPGLMGTLDGALGHLRRYDPSALRSALATAGFDVERVFDFNRVSVPGWWLNGRLLRRKTFSRVQLKLLDTAMPLLRRIDRLWPWPGLSLIGIAVKR